MRFTSTPVPTRKPSSKSLNTKGFSGVATDGVFEQEMDVDENGSHDDWDRMETEEADGRYGRFEDRIEQALKYAQELKQDYKDDKRKEITSSLQEIFSLFAYEDPRSSPTAHVLDPSGRVPVAEELNSAILGKLVKRLRRLECANGIYSVSWQIFVCSYRASVSADGSTRYRHQ